MLIRQSPSGPRIAFGLVAMQMAIKESDPQTIVPATPTLVTRTPGVTLTVGYTAQANHRYREDVEAIINASNVAAGGTDTWQGELLRSIDGGATWTNVANAQIRETETADATQAMPLWQNAPEEFAPVVDTDVLFALRLTGATSNVSLLAGNANLKLKVWE